MYKRRRLFWRWLLVGGLCLAISGTGQLAMAQTILILSETEAWFVPADESTATRVDRIIKINGHSPTPPPAPPGTLKALAQQWNTKVPMYEKRDQHRRGLSAMYQLLGDQIGQGSVKNLQDLQVLTSRVRDMLLGSDKDKWNTWGQAIGERLSSTVSSLDQAKSAYLEIAAGLDVGEALSPELLALIMMIIKLVLELITKKS